MNPFHTALFALALASPAFAATVVPANDDPDTVDLVIDLGTGEGFLVGNAGDPAELTSYQINSAGSMLDPSAWDSLEDQGFPGWSELPATSGRLGEVNLFDDLSLGGTPISLGLIYAAGTDEATARMDLRFIYGEESEDGDPDSDGNGEVVLIPASSAIPEPLAAMGGLSGLAAVVLRRRAGRR